MNLLVVDNFHNLTYLIEEQFRFSGCEAKIKTVEALEDLVAELKTGNHDCIVAEYAFRDIDIWHLARLVSSERFKQHAIPICLISDTCPIDIPPTLARAYGIKVMGLKAFGRGINARHYGGSNLGQGAALLEQSKPTVLIIDDDKNMSGILKDALEPNYVVHLAHTGEEGIASWKQHRHELILLDYMLPGIKGSGVLKSIMEVDFNQPVIVITGLEQEELDVAMILNGASDFLRKPLTIPKLIGQCQSVLNRAQLNYQNQHSVDKNALLSNLVMEIEDAVVHEDMAHVRKCIVAIKRILPVNYTEDDQATLMAQRQPRA